MKNKLIEWEVISSYLNERLGSYLNTMVSDLDIDEKGQYLRDLFSDYGKELSNMCRKIACEQKAKTLNAVCEELKLEERKLPYPEEEFEKVDNESLSMAHMRNAYKITINRESYQEVSGYNQAVSELNAKIEKLKQDLEKE